MVRVWAKFSRSRSIKPLKRIRSYSFQGSERKTLSWQTDPERRSWSLEQLWALGKIQSLLKLHMKPSKRRDREGETKTPAEVGPEMLVLYWTGTWWSRVNDERVKERKRLLFPGLRSQLSCSRESARNREIETKKERKTGDPSSDGAKVF